MSLSTPYCLKFTPNNRIGGGWSYNNLPYYAKHSYLFNIVHHNLIKKDLETYD